MRAQKMINSRILLVTLTVIMLPIATADVLCFCNSPSCPQAVCKSSQQCFSRLQRRVKADGNVSTSVMYGCIRTMNSSYLCLNSSLMICCNKDLCNIPNMLRKITKTYQRTQMDTTEHAPNVNKVNEPVTRCTDSTSAMQVASVAAPSVLILTVVLLSLAMFYKMARYQKIRTMQIKRGVKNREAREGLIQKVRELKGCGLVVRSNGPLEVFHTPPEVFHTEVGMSRSCSENDNRE